MTVSAIGARVVEIEGMIAALRAGPAGLAGQAVTTGGAAAPASFADALRGAQATAASAVPATSGAPVPFAADIDAAAQRHGVDPALLRGLVRQESGFDPSARSSAGAAGLTQLMPATARSLGVSDPLDPVQALDGGARYLRQQLDRFGGDVTRALAAYNAGPGAVARFGGVPPYDETRTYVQRVQQFAAEYRTPASTTSPPPVPSPPPISGSLPYSTT